MKEERNVLQDIIGTAPPKKEESKTQKYVRIVLGVIFMSFFVYLMVMAALRRYGS